MPGISAFSLPFSTKEGFSSINNFNGRSQHSRIALSGSRQQHSIYATITPAPAENVEMEYNGRSHLSPASWKAVPGGFLPQIPKDIGTFSQRKVHLEADSQRISEEEERIRNGPSSTLNTSKSKGNISSSPMKRNSTPNTSMTRIRQLATLQDYKHYVVDDIDPEITTITVVRFYAPWCRACQAIQQRYYRLAQLYEQRQIIQPPPSEQELISTSSSFSIQQPRVSSMEQKKVLVRFMECPVTKDNAILHQGLGVPSLPYGHIYHSQAGLVEEMKLNKNVFARFESTLASYVNGYCNVNYGDNDFVIEDHSSTSIDGSS